MDQALEAIRLVTDDPETQTDLLRQVLSDLATIDLLQTPPVMGRHIHRLVREVAGCDPYVELKARCNAMAAKALPETRRLVENAEDPFEMAVRFAMAGNNIDAGMRKEINEQMLDEALAQVAKTTIDHSAVKALRQAVERAGDILFLGDNCGEIYFDKLLLEQMPLAKVTYVVRGGPIINDATMADAEEAGLTDMVTVVDNGSDGPGTILEDCSEAFMRRYEAADLIIAKGQGNFETLSEEPRNIFFLLRAKCPVIAAHVGCPQGAFVVMRAATAPTA